MPSALHVRITRCSLLGIALSLAACTVSELDLDFDGDGIEDRADCGPDDPDIRPGAEDPFGDGIDQDCDGIDGVDRDGDGALAPGDGVAAEVADCADANPNAYPGATEVVDGIDNDCDGAVDEGTEVFDDDGDGFCESSTACLGAASPGDCDDEDPDATPGDEDGDGVSTCDSEPDCDDHDPARVPGARELCDGLDNDCDGVVAGGELDGDGDGQPPCGGDCDDADADLHSLDEDGDGQTLCDAVADCDDNDATVIAADVDRDGVRDCDGDCDDHDSSIGPFAVEVCSLLDEDCDGVPGPGEIDSDGDGDPACSDCDDADPTIDSLDRDGDGATSCAGDCFDLVAGWGPSSADQIGDGVDSNCDGTDGLDLDGDGEPAGIDCDDADPGLNHADADGDGWTPCTGDCDDSDPSIGGADLDLDGASACQGDCDDGNYALRPSATEVCDLLDNDCDGVQDALEVDADGDGDAACSDCDESDPTLHSFDLDGDGSSPCAGDCDDADPAYRPGALDPVGDGLDTDCDDFDGVDSDEDGFGSLASFGEDCDDGNAAIYPGAPDPVGDGVDSDCDGLDADDADNDGYGALAQGGDDCDDFDPAVHPGFFEADGDGVDANCDGVDGNAALVFVGTAGDATARRPMQQTLCDLDGDGSDDLVIASAWADPGAGDEGLISIWYGPLDPTVPLPAADATLQGAAPGDLAGHAIACAGDTDGDGVQELAVGAAGVLGCPPVGGALYIVNVPPVGAGVVDSSYPELYGCFNDPGLPGTPVLGSALVGGGDLDGDGLDDLAALHEELVGSTLSVVDLASWNAGSEVTVSVRYGPIDSSSYNDLNSLNDSYSLSAGEYGAVARWGAFGPMAFVDDVNGDGLDDLLAGSYGRDDFVVGFPAGGVARLFYGPVLGSLAEAGAQGDIDTTPTFDGARPQVAGLGDLNGDGFGDFAVTTADGAGPGDAAVHLFYGPRFSDLDVAFADAVLRLDPGGAVSLAPTVAPAGDVDGDGVQDIVWTTAQEDAGVYSSAAWLVRGPFGGVMTPSHPRVEPVISLPATSVNEPVWLWAVPSADLTGDGRPELLLGVFPGGDPQPTAPEVRVFLNPAG